MKQTLENNLYLISSKRLFIDGKTNMSLKNGYSISVNMYEKNDKKRNLLILKIILFDIKGIAAYALEISKKMKNSIMNMSILEKINYILEPNHLFGKKEYDKVYHSFIYDIPLPDLDVQYIISQEAHDILFDFKHKLAINKLKIYKRKVR